MCVYVCVCALACAGGSNALCETKRNGRMLYDSVISLWVTYAHTRRPGLRGGQHTETVVPTHTDQNNVFVRKENSFMGHTPTHTHIGVGGLSPCPCAGQPNYLSAPHCFLFDSLSLSLSLPLSHCRFVFPLLSPLSLLSTYN